jgi:uncharacterized protein
VTAPGPVISGRRLLAALVAWLVGAALLLGLTVLVLRLVVRSWTVRHVADALAIQMLEVYVALVLALVLVFGVRGIRDRLGFRYTGPGGVALAIGTWLVAGFAGLLLNAAAQPLLGPPQDNARRVLTMASDPLFIGIVTFVVCLLAPFAEELLFRGLLLGWLLGRMPAAVAIGVTAALFAAVHLTPALLPFLFTLGIATGYLRWRTGSTFNSFVAHASQNTFATLATLAVLHASR